MSISEFHQLYLSNPIEIPSETTEEITSVQARPDSIDWRTKGAITPIKNQGSCGDCYAFSTVSCVESLWFLAGNKLVTLSEEQILDCSGPWGNTGCYGGNVAYGFAYVKSKGLTLSSNYPYTGKQSTCNSTAQGLPVTKISSSVYVKYNDYTALLNAVAIRPVSVAVQAD
jgi:cathepsin L